MKRTANRIDRRTLPRWRVRGIGYNGQPFAARSQCATLAEAADRGRFWGTVIDVALVESKARMELARRQCVAAYRELGIVA